MKKLLSFLVTIVMIVGIIPCQVMAENADGLSEVVFYDSENNVITAIDGNKSVHAKVTFDAADGVADIIVSSYDSIGKFTGIKYMGEAKSSPCITPEFSASESELIKVIVFEDMTSMKPLLSRAGTIAAAPEATVESLNVAKIAKESNISLSSALNFKADEVTKAQLEAYGDWYVDFVLTINKDITLNANGSADGYLAGQYDSWSSNWVAVPSKETVLKANEPFKIMATAAEQLGKKGLKYTYREVYEIVKDFDCGIYFKTDFIKNNPGLKATLSLRMFNPTNEAEYFTVGEEQVFDYTLPEATVTPLNVEQIKEEAGVELSSAVNFSANVVTPEQLGAYSEWYTDFAVIVNKDATFNATGEGACGYLAGQYDSYSKNWLKVPSSNVSIKAGDSIKIMETAAELLGKKGLKYTYKEVYEIVKNFNCGIYFNEEFLLANPELEVKLELRLYNPVNEQEYIVVGEPCEFQFKPKAVNKFVANDNLNYKLGQNGIVEVKLGEIFAPVNGANISSADLTLSVKGDNCEYNIDKNDWGQSTLRFTGVGQFLFFINDNNNCLDASATVTITEPDKTVKFEKKFNKDFLYRVGNLNNVSLDSLFSVAEGTEIGTISVTVEPVDGTGASGELVPNTDWKNASIDFNGTGVVKVTITDNAYCIPTELYLEVVDAKNITSAEGSTTGATFVLLNNVTLNGYINYWNSTLYGNGFTFDISAGSLTYHTYNSKQGHGLIIAKNSIIDNLVVTGAVYPGYGAYSNQDYYNAAIASEGSTIQNCYISNCSTPIRAMGSTTVKNTTLYGGTVANMHILNGVATLDNITTVNYNDDRNALGLGIVVASDATDSAEIIIENSLKQYNFIKESDKSSISDQFGRMVIDSMFGNEFDAYKFTVGSDVYVNSGIVAMKDGFNTSKIHDNANTGYIGNVAKMSTGTSTVNGYVYTQPKTSGNVDNGYIAENDAHISAVQGLGLPVFHFTLGEQAKEIDADTYMRQAETDGIIKAQYKEGETPLTIDLTKLVSVKRYDGVAYTVNAQCVAPNGSVLADNNGVVTLNASGDYTLKFTVQDDYIYDNAGNKTGASVTWTYENKLSLNIKAPEAKNAEVSITKTSLDGVYKTVNMNDYKLRINFLDAISVKDYKNTASAAETVALTSNIKSATISPSGVNVFTTASTVTIEYTDGRKLVVELSKISGSSPSTKTAAINTSGGVYFLTDGALNNKPTEAASQNKCTITSVKFTGYSGETVTNDTDVAVTWALGSSSSGGDSCLAEGTLITLADGSKRAVEDLRKGDMVMSYDHVNGELTAEEVIIVVKTTTDLFYKNTFVFDDDTMLTTINEHGIYDLDLNKYVNIDHNNYKEFIGHSFVSVDTEGKLGTKKLVDVICEIGSGYKYDIVTDGTLNYVAEDTLSVTHVLVDVINSFEFADDMKYDKEKMYSDIETYGLYSYDEWADYCDISVFEEYNIPVMKVGISKGMYSKEYIIDLINTYVLDESVQIIG